MRARAIAVSLAALLHAACTTHAPPPTTAPRDASGGYAPPGFDAESACSEWIDATGSDDEPAHVHTSFPELDVAKSCYVPVRYGPEGPRADPAPAGCGYPREPDTFATLERSAERYESIAAGAPSGPLPLDLACALPEDARRAVARSNARTLRALPARLRPRAAFPYAAVSTFGYGHSGQRTSTILRFVPGEACPDVDAHDMELFSVNAIRARRAADAYRAGVAPVVTVSGGAVHSPLVEAFMLFHLLSCRFGVPGDAILLDPCADHTHTNIRNTGALVRALGGRTAYIVTDDGTQATYLEEWTAFDLIGGSIDQRALRDFGYLLGSHRRASVGMRAGFWYTPYRFWAEPERGLGSFTCIP
jgi:hypothetical protein